MSRQRGDNSATVPGEGAQNLRRRRLLLMARTGTPGAPQPHAAAQPALPPAGRVSWVQGRGVDPAWLPLRPREADCVTVAGAAVSQSRSALGTGSQDAGGLLPAPAPSIWAGLLRFSSKRCLQLAKPGRAPLPGLGGAFSREPLPSVRQPELGGVFLSPTATQGVFINPQGPPPAHVSPTSASLSAPSLPRRTSPARAL